MFKKLLVIFILIGFLAGCGCAKKEEPKIDFKGPTTTLDPSKLIPTYGPNDPVPVEDPTEDPMP